MTKKQRLPWKGDMKEKIFQRDGYECIYCGTDENLSLDHIVPFSSGGDDTVANLVTACRQCNSKKHKNRLLPSLEEYVLSIVSQRNSDNEIIPCTVATVNYSRKERKAGSRKTKGERKRLHEKGERRRAYAQYNSLVARVESVSTIYVVEGLVTSDRKIQSICRAANRRKLKTLIIPLRSEGKYVFLDGDPGVMQLDNVSARQVSHSYAISIIQEFATSNTSKKVSGKLGLP
jgi:hypothetical protein